MRRSCRHPRRGLEGLDDRGREPGRADDDEPVVLVRRIGQVGRPPAVVQRRARRLPRPPSAASARPSDVRSSIAADRIVPVGFAMSRPAMSGAEPWIGSYSPNVPCSVRRSPSDADGRTPRLPARTAASSDRMSPNRFSVTMTSKSAGRRTSSIAHESTSWWVSRTSGKSTAISSVTRRHSRDVARTLALSTWVSAAPARPRQLEGEPDDPGDLVLGVRQRVERRPRPRARRTPRSARRSRSRRSARGR